MVREGNNILNMFKYYFPHYAEQISWWEPLDEHTILIHKERGKEFVFTYVSKDLWRFETKDSYENHDRIKG